MSNLMFPVLQFLEKWAFIANWFGLMIIFITFALGIFAYSEENYQTRKSKKFQDFTYRRARVIHIFLAMVESNRFRLPAPSQSERELNQIDKLSTETTKKILFWFDNIIIYSFMSQIKIFRAELDALEDEGIGVWGGPKDLSMTLSIADKLEDRISYAIREFSLRLDGFREEKSDWAPLSEWELVTDFGAIFVSSVQVGATESSLSQCMEYLRWELAGHYP